MPGDWVQQPDCTAAHCDAPRGVTRTTARGGVSRRELHVCAVRHWRVVARTI